ncbi:MAG: hypothetical protein E6640_01945 [Actinomyces urogenitalis]|uniref:hypothetical protein n=1 Tax=Actinomyces urogenitalis TaxID=103621 RepID=UPI00290BDCD8|nr:hypothetical protein [Actinomyces urogenitalis]MDU6150974.1 hypothetical protein [Actinomyces urogenitalis]
MEAVRSLETRLVIDSLGNSLPASIEQAKAPAPGQVWTISINGDERGCVMIVAVDDSDVLAWPVTAPFDGACSPCVAMDLPGGPTVLWAHALFGFSAAALGRLIATPIQPRGVHAIRSGKLPQGFHALDDGTLPEREEMTVASWSWGVSDWDWRAGGVLDTQNLKDLGLDANGLAKILSLPPGEAVQAFNGETLADPAWVDALSSLYGEDNEYLAYIDSLEADVLDLTKYKDKVAHLTTASRNSEQAVRQQAWNGALALAARGRIADPRADAMRRVESSLDLLATEYGC